MGPPRGAKGCNHVVEGRSAVSHKEECINRIEYIITKDQDPRAERMNERMERLIFEE